MFKKCYSVFFLIRYTVFFSGLRGNDAQPAGSYHRDGGRRRGHCYSPQNNGLAEETLHNEHGKLTGLSGTVVRLLA